jgi:aldehyde:ferredoxin oxidoreductase
MYGSNEKILRVNLTTGAIAEEILSEDFYRLYPGGKALAGYYLLNEMPALNRYAVHCVGALPAY